MNDFLPADARQARRVEEAFRRTMERAGFGEVRTPIVEGTGLFVRTIGEGTDVVDKIRTVKTGSRGMHQDVPVEDVIIEKAEIV